MPSMACEEAGIAPVISIAVKDDTIVITDNGPGIPAKTINAILDYSIRVSSREAYASPTRGAQGNALKTILPMAYVLNERHGEDASGKTVIEANGVAHHIAFSVDHIKQEPKIAHTTKHSSVTKGTRITVTLPAIPSQYSDCVINLVDYCKGEFLRLAESYAWVNPHLSLRVSWDGERKIDIKASNPAWQKWLPSWPTSAHWYDQSRFRRYMAAHIAHRGDITVREFVSEFRGLTASAKHKANTKNIAKLLASLKDHTKPVRPADLGIIGKQHFYALMERAGGDPKTFTYNSILGETGGIPRVVEFAFGIHRKGLSSSSGPGPLRKIITSVNWSPGINNPFRQLGRNGESLDGILSDVRANTTQPVIAVLHLACPRVAYTDRGKSAIVVDGIREDDDGEES
jgi:hypothetical protein